MLKQCTSQVSSSGQTAMILATIQGKVVCLMADRVFKGGEWLRSMLRQPF